ncbi:MAG: DUF4301 family protein [Flavobacteriales bacterium]|nr:MAG: DUF4301 family protein [Flavobacteriales bacterium]
MQEADDTRQIISQKNKIQSGSPKIEIIAPCILNNGIIGISKTEQSELTKLFEDENQELMFFIPASGSGSRMFDFLNSSASDAHLEKDEKVTVFLNELESFAFYDDELKSLYVRWKNGTIDSRELISNVIGPLGKNFSKLPKGLIPFHSLEEGVLNAFQEHVLQGSVLSEKSRFHFTIQKLFEETFLSSRADLENRFEKEYDVSFSVQNSDSDSYAFDKSMQEIPLKNEGFLRRPSGHGALLENLINIDNQFILIKNIDNVQHLYSSDKTVEIWKILCGLLFKVKTQLKHIYDNPSLESLRGFNHRYQLYTSEQIDISDDAILIKELINRPLRISGMVQNQGKAGGGPFFVKDRNGTVSKQIIEGVQVSSDLEQQKLMSNSTHFNPVMMVLDVYDFEGKKHELKKFRNDENYFVVNKMYQGENISFVELPGLWNGAMYDWNTVFVEIPVETFTPVKTVLDLLDSNHQLKK